MKSDKPKDQKEKEQQEAIKDINAYWDSKNNRGRKKDKK